MCSFVGEYVYNTNFLCVCFIGNNNVNNNNNNGVNEYVRRELRNVVAGRQQQGDTCIRLPPLQLGLGQQVNSPELESLGLSLEMPNGWWMRFNVLL